MTICEEYYGILERKRNVYLRTTGRVPEEIVISVLIERALAKNGE